jgi:hypothetical protein
MSATVRVWWVAFAILSVSVTAPQANAVESQFVVGLHGATFMPWGAVEETGNGYGLTLGVNLDDWRLLAGVGGVLPQSSPHGHFSALWLETQWHPFQDVLRQWGVPLWPYALLGVGVALGDDYGDSNALVPVPSTNPVRWVPEEPQPVVMTGLGFAVGDFHGFSVAMDIRIYNDVFGGFVVSAGYAY